MNFGVTLSNRGVLVGLCSARDLLMLAAEFLVHGADRIRIGEEDHVDLRIAAVEQRVRDVMGEVRRRDRSEKRLSAAFLERKLLDRRLSRDRGGFFGDRGHDNTTGALLLAWYAGIVAIGGRSTSMMSCISR